MMYWVLHIIIIGGLGFLYQRKFGMHFSLVIYWTALVLKLSAGIILGFIFFEYYGIGDTISFHRQALDIADQPFNEYLATLFETSSYRNSLQPRVLFFTKLISIFLLISGGSYWITSLYLSLISFFASCYVVNVLSKIYPQFKWIYITSFLFIPTIVFWSSGVIKESITYSALIFLVVAFIKINKTNKLGLIEWLLSIIGLYIMWRVKHYLLITFLLFISFTWLIQLLKSSSNYTKWMTIPLLFVALIATQWVHPYLKIDRLPQTIYENNQAIISKTDVEDQLTIDIKTPTWSSVINEIPEAVRTGLFRPSLIDPTPIWGWIHRIENTVLILLMILSLLLLSKSKNDIDLAYVVAGLVSICLLATLLALTTPNFGTLVRYKTAFMPFLFLLSSILPFQYFTSKTS